MGVYIAQMSSIDAYGANVNARYSLYLVWIHPDLNYVVFTPDLKCSVNPTIEANEVFEAHSSVLRLIEGPSLRILNHICRRHEFISSSLPIKSYTQ